MVNIEIDGIALKVDATKMIIQAADEAGIDIPRFCYHKKLSIAANCRMCLVEVDKARKPVPACATPVAEGMKVFTQSKVAMDAQRSVMEFLLINHPLDCPICDQGGECELQDLSMGYGSGISRFSEGKRVVADKDIGPLIQTDMTRCIHCTRCVRFGEEIAGLRELGATGRGEHMEIGTYVEHSLVSELSGNIIDLCPVGALTSKPFRYRARAWEMRAHPSIAPHDPVGSSIELHVRGDEILRVVPRDNEAVNESWISDRDRFAYLGLTHPQRALRPMIKRDGQWHETGWQDALEHAVAGVKSLVAKHGADELGALVSPTATVEEGFLLQKWLRGMGSEHIDHRLRQQDFRDGTAGEGQTTLGLEDIQHSDAVLLLGSDIRSEAPIVAHRIRQAAQAGSSVIDINFLTRELLMPVQLQLAVDAAGMLSTLAGIARALATDAELGPWDELLPQRAPGAFEHNVAVQLANAMRPTLIVGHLAMHHPEASKLRALAALIARLCDGRLLLLPEANGNGLSQAGVLPGPEGMNACQMWQGSLRGYIMLGVEPLNDCADPVQVRQAMQRASFTLAVTSFVSDELSEYADVILPMAAFGETSGTFVGMDGQWQSFAGAVPPRGDSRPGWKILRVLGNLCKHGGFDQVSSAEVAQEARNWQTLRTQGKTHEFIPDTLQLDRRGQRGDVMMISQVPIYRGDALLRRSLALQQTAAGEAVRMARIHPGEAARLGLTMQRPVMIRQGEHGVMLPLELDPSVAEGCIHVAAASDFSVQLGPMFGQVSLSHSQSGVEA